MKQVSTSQLTSNDVVNKIIISNLQVNDKITIERSGFGIVDRWCIDVVLEEFKNNRLTKEECHFAFDKQFHLSDKISSMSTHLATKVISTGYRLDLFAQHPSWLIRRAVSRIK